MVPPRDPVVIVRYTKLQFAQPYYMQGVGMITNHYWKVAEEYKNTTIMNRITKINFKGHKYYSSIQQIGESVNILSVFIIYIFIVILLKTIFYHTRIFNFIWSSFGPSKACYIKEVIFLRRLPNGKKALNLTRNFAWLHIYIENYHTQ